MYCRTLEITIVVFDKTIFPTVLLLILLVAQGQQVCAQATYEIQNVFSGKVLDVTGGTASGSNSTPLENGTLIQQWDYSGGPNQQWQLIYLGQNTYQIINLQSGKVLDVVGGSDANGARIQQYSWLNGGNQKWSLLSQSNGSYVIQNVQSGNVLDVTGGMSGTALQNGDPIQQWSSTGAANQQWNIVQVIPNSLTITQSNSCSYGGTWTESSGPYPATWNLTQAGNEITGFVTTSYSPACGTVTWEASGNTNGPDGFLVQAYNPQPATDLCGDTPNTPVSETVSLASTCQQGWAEAISSGGFYDTQWTVNTAGIGIPAVDGYIALSLSDYDAMVDAGTIARGAGTVILITDPVVIAVTGAAVVLVAVAYFGEKAYQAYKAGQYEPIESKPCGAQFVHCLEYPWGVNFNNPTRNDCLACYRQCLNAGGKWPYNKCPA